MDGCYHLPELINDQLKEDHDAYKDRILLAKQIVVQKILPVGRHQGRKNGEPCQKARQPKGMMLLEYKYAY